MSKILDKNLNTMYNKLKSYTSAMNCDPISSFGGIVACNYKINLKTAKEIMKKYYEVIIKTKNIRTDII